MSSNLLAMWAREHAIMTTIERQTDATPRTITHRAAPALLVGIAGAVTVAIGSWIPSYWGDEAASVMSATRSWPSLVAELTTIDAVHGLYYALLHVWVTLFGASEFAARLPSAIGIGFMAAGTVTLARQFGGTRFAILAGVVAIALPRSTAMGIEARSYALGAAAAVWLTVLLVHLLRRPHSRRWWVLYSCAAAASAVLFLYLGLMILVHGVFIAIAHRQALRRWAASAALAGLLSAPILIMGYLERHQIDFLARRSYATVTNVVVKQWFGSAGVALICWGLIIVAVAWAFWPRRAAGPTVRELAVLLVGWLVVPTVVLLAVNAFVSPSYNVRYLSMSTPAAALLVAGGLALVGASIARRLRSNVPITTLVVVTALLAALLPGYLTQRGPYAKDGGSDWRQVAAVVGAGATPGEAVIFDELTKPSRDPRLAIHLYPAAFAGLRDVELVTPFDATSGLWDRVASLRDSRAALLHSRGVWAIELASATTTPPDVRELESLGFHIETTTHVHRSTVYHLTR